MLLVSACLAGFPCRYDGGTNFDARIAELVHSGKAIPVCPEQLGGLPTPRSPAEKRDGLIVNREGRDVSAAFQKGAAAVLQIARIYGCTAAILKSRSPSCGKGRIYDGSFTGTLIDGSGTAAALLLANGIEVQTEEEY